MKMRILFFMLLIIMTTMALPQNKPEEKLEAVTYVDLARYIGTWYEIARLPNGFQKKCVSDVTTYYTLLDDGQIKVVNRCRCEGGSFKEAEGRARKARTDGPNTKLEVRFAPAFLSFLPFVWGKYWIIDLAEDYCYAVVGEPNREYLWILGRSPKLDEELFNEIIERIKIKGYNVSKLIRTKHTQ
jgi:apolipoprotein D and lipocalin family protein